MLLKHSDFKLISPLLFISACYDFVVSNGAVWISESNSLNFTLIRLWFLNINVSWQNLFLAITVFNVADKDILCLGWRTSLFLITDENFLFRECAVWVLARYDFLLAPAWQDCININVRWDLFLDAEVIISIANCHRFCSRFFALDHLFKSRTAVSARDFYSFHPALTRQHGFFYIDVYGDDHVLAKAWIFVADPYFLSGWSNRWNNCRSKRVYEWIIDTDVVLTDFSCIGFVDLCARSGIFVAHLDIVIFVRSGYGLSKSLSFFLSISLSFGCN